MSRAALITLASLAIVLQGCGGGGGSDPAPGPPPGGPQIVSFAAVGSDHAIGEPAQLVAQFTGGTGRIDPGALPVTSGQAVSTPRLAQDTTFRLTVADGPATVTRDLTVDVRYRDRLRAIDMPFAREGHVTVELDDGRVLVIGGSEAGGGTLPTKNFAFDPDTETFAEFGALIDPRYDHVAVVLENGDVLVTGGDVQLPATREAEIIDARTGAAFTTGAPTRNRLDAAAVRLTDGRVLVVGGFTNGPDATAELYDPATGQFTPTAGTLNYGRFAHTATLLADGRVLIYGGFTVGAIPVPPEIYDPATQSFSVVQPPEVTERGNHTALTLQGGRVGIFGGETFAAEPRAETLAFAASPDRFEPLADLAERRTLAPAAVLADGRVLLAGGYVSTIAEASAGTELVAANGDASASGPPMSAARVLHTVNRLRSGKALIVGGRSGTGAPHATAELYE